MPFVFDGAYNITSTSAELWFEFTGGDASYGNYRPLRLTISGTNYNNRVFDSENKGGGDSWWEIPVSGLAPDTKYTVKAQLGFYTGSTPTWLSLYAEGSFRTAKAAPEVDYWSWTESNGSATAAQTRNAYSILQGTRTADDFSHNVWNDFVDKIVEVREARGFQWSNGYATLAKTKAAAGDTLSAVRFNSVWHNIQHLKGTGLPEVSSGDEIFGEQIIILTDTLNAIIDNL
jgi:hypothetical protein